MPEPIYEVKIKGEETTPAPATPSLSEEKIASMIDEKAQTKADEIATLKVDALKEELAESLTGKKNGQYADKNPESWDKFQQDTNEKSAKMTEQMIEERFKARDKETADKAKLSQKQVVDEQNKEYSRISTEWNEAVKDGLLPDIGAAVKAKLQTGTTYEQLTVEEQKDAGLRAYNGARALYIQQKNNGETSSFYRTASKYTRQPAGARAPVIGGGVAVADAGEELDYAEVAKNRKSKFGF